MIELKIKGRREGAAVRWAEGNSGNDEGRVGRKMENSLYAKIVFD